MIIQHVSSETLSARRTKEDGPVDSLGDLFFLDGKEAFDRRQVSELSMLSMLSKLSMLSQLSKLCLLSHLSKLCLLSHLSKRCLLCLLSMLSQEASCFLNILSSHPYYQLQNFNILFHSNLESLSALWISP